MMSMGDEMLIVIVGFVILVTRLFPATPLARGMHLWCVELPLRLLARLERKHLILIGVILCCSQTLVLAASSELALAWAMEIALYTDAALAASFAAAAGRIKAAWSVAAAVLARLLRPGRRARPARAARG
jgi:hypothetical protein